ncbi:LOW QUALITY PROTEIN: hypothetical protein YC2023_017020 [Brassica napus]
MTFNECFSCSDKESLAVGTELLLFGKEVMSHVIYKYSVLTHAWTSNEYSEVLGEVAVVAGGCDPRGKILNSAEIYSLESGEWTVIPSMNKARKMCSWTGASMLLERETRRCLCVVYDLKKKTWTLIPNMLQQGSNGGGDQLVAVVKDELYSAHYAQQEVRKYDKRRNVWNKVGNLPERASWMNGLGMAFRACGDKLVVVPGPRGVGRRTIEINACVPREGKSLHWRVLASKPSESFVYNWIIWWNWTSFNKLEEDHFFLHSREIPHKQQNNTTSKT